MKQKTYLESLFGNRRASEKIEAELSTLKSNKDAVYRQTWILPRQTKLLSLIRGDRLFHTHR